MKYKAAILVAAMALIQPKISSAVIVIDPVVASAVNTESAKQIALMKQEIALLKQQLEEAKRLYNATNGSTSMADIAAPLNSESSRKLIDSESKGIATAFDLDLKDVFSMSLKPGEVGVSVAAQGAFNGLNLSIKDVSTKNFNRQELDRAKAQSARDAAIGERIIESADDRLNNMQAFNGALRSATTQKEVDALSARIQYEAALLQNDTNRIQGLAMLKSTRDTVAKLRNREIRDKNRESRSKAMQMMFGDQ